MKQFILTIALCVLGGVLIISARGSGETAVKDYEDARQNYETQLEYCAHLPVHSAEFDVVCKDLSAARPVAP